jgi:hypothetical protein
MESLANSGAPIGFGEDLESALIDLGGEYRSSTGNGSETKK